MLKSTEEVRHQVNRCSKCGSCREVCPVFLQMGSEPWVARARVQLTGAVLKGQLTFSRRLGEIMDTCLLCQACTAHCPNGVKVPDLVLWARVEAVRKRGLSLPKRVVLRGTLLFQRRMTLLSKTLALCQQKGFLKNFRGRKLPSFHKSPFNRLFRPAEPPKSYLTVAYFAGCMTQYVYHQTGQAVMKVLEQNKVRVLLADTGCCGMPALAAGDFKTATWLARHNLKTLKKLEADFIVTDCASCGKMLKAYGKLLEEGSAQEMADRVQDISYFLVNTSGFMEGKIKVPLTVTYHDPCHLKRSQGIYREPRQIIDRIAGLTLIEMPQSDTCCGLAGSFGFTHPVLSQKILKEKIRNIKVMEVQAVITGCPSCRWQLSSGLAEEGLSLPVWHTVELLAMGYGVEF